MIRNFNSYGEMNITKGDRVVIKYKHAKDFMKTGTVISIVYRNNNMSDCSVLMDFENRVENYYYTNLMKVINVVEYPSGEILNVPYENLMELSIAGILKFNSSKNYYYFDESERWQIESIAI